MPLLEDILGRIHVEEQLLRLLFHSLMESKLLLCVYIYSEYCNSWMDFSLLVSHSFLRCSHFKSLLKVCVEEPSALQLISPLSLYDVILISSTYHFVWRSMLIASSSYFLVNDFCSCLFMNIGRKKLVLTVYPLDKRSYLSVPQIGQMN